MHVAKAISSIFYTTYRAGHVRGARACPEEWGTSWVVMGQLIKCRRLWGGSPGRRSGEEDASLGSGRVCISMGAVGGAMSWLL